MSLRQLWFSPGNDIATLATYWCNAVQPAREQGVRRRHYLEMRYENLVIHTEETLRRICDFLDLPFEYCQPGWVTRGIRPRFRSVFVRFAD